MAHSYEEGREYWSEFDKIYPHYVIEKYLEEGVGDLNKTMIIFKNYMQEVSVRTATNNQYYQAILFGFPCSTKCRHKLANTDSIELSTLGLDFYFRFATLFTIFIIE